jgi:hypothetical protein
MLSVSRDQLLVLEDIEKSCSKVVMNLPVAIAGGREVFVLGPCGIRGDVLGPDAAGKWRSFGRIQGRSNQSGATDSFPRQDGTGLTGHRFAGRVTRPRGDVERDEQGR